MKGGQLHKVLTSTGSPGSNPAGTTNWPTPRWLVLQMAEEFGPFDLDPAADASNAKAPAYFTEADDGLSQPWSGRVWLNPPWGKVDTPRWLAKAKAEVDAGNAELVACLVRVSAGTRWWRDYERDPAVFIRILGRIYFPGGSRGGSPFDLALIVFGRLTGRHGRWPETCANPDCPRPYRRFWPAQANRRTCSDRCRQALWRSRSGG